MKELTGLIMMGFTFVTDRAAYHRLLPTCPRGHAVTGAFSAERLNWRI
jgi:hypothetical protein